MTHDARKPIWERGPRGWQLARGRVPKGSPGPLSVPALGRARMGADPRVLPEWVQAMVDLRSDHAMWPVAEFVVNKYGAHNAVRANASQGACGPKPGEPSTFDSLADEQRVKAARFPCTHKGADLTATEGTDVVVPHDGYLLYLGPADKAPFIGYGPNVALIAHADVADSFWGRAWKWATGPLVDIFDFPEGSLAGSYSLISHFDLRPGASFDLPGDIWDSTRTKPNPEHWRRNKKNESQVFMMSDADAAREPARRVFMGDKLGFINGAMGHIHWEIRPSPLAEKAFRIDPIATWRQAYNLALPGASRVAQPAGGGGGGLLLLLAMLAMSGKRTRSRSR